MTTVLPESKGKYLYAVVEKNGTCLEDRLAALGPVGIEGSGISLIAVGDVAAVVSDVEGPRIRPQRRNLAAHQGVLKRLMEEKALLPISFGMIADSARAVEKFLSTHQTDLHEQLQRVVGKVEMGLHVRWDVPNIFEYFVNTHRELRSARDRLVRPGRDANQEEMIELGRLFDRLLSEERSDLTERVEAVLSPSCAEIKPNNCRTETEVMNLVCLIERSKVDEFESRVFEAARFFDDHYAFDFSGPWAPHNFVQIGAVT